MSNTQPRFTSLTLAAYSWSPADWPQTFYPDDLPQGWQVSYYANEFNYVLLPVSSWVSPAANAAFWQAEAGEGFGFYLEMTAALLQSANWQPIQQAVEQHLAGQVAGLLVTDDAVAGLPSAWQERFPVHVLGTGQWLANMPVGADAQLAVLHSSRLLPPLELRNLFESMQQHTAHRDVVLFVDAPYAVVEQLRLMQQLYGV